MKNMFISILVLVCMAFTVPAFAGTLDDTTSKTGAAAVAFAGSGELMQLFAFADSDENTAAVRAWHFYDAATVATAGAANYAFSITFTVGAYPSGELYRGFLSNQFGYTHFDGIDFATGCVISPTAGTLPAWKVLYKD